MAEDRRSSKSRIATRVVDVYPKQLHLGRRRCEEKCSRVTNFGLVPERSMRMIRCDVGYISLNITEEVRVNDQVFGA